MQRFPIFSLAARALAVAALALFVTAAQVAAFSAGPPDGYCGDPPTTNYCTFCHNSFELNSGDGMVSLSGLPTEYAPDTNYFLTIDVADEGQMRWGFEMTVIDTPGDEGGALSILDGNTQVSGFPDDGVRDYIKHTGKGTQSGEPAGTWNILWTSPLEGTGDVTFYLAGNAANGNFFNSGDYIYAIEVPLSEEGSAVGAPTLGPLATLPSLRAFPNPATASSVTLQLSLPAAGTIDFDIVDVRGRSLSQFQATAPAAGVFEIPAQLRGLPAGRYWVRASGAFGNRVAPLTILR